MLIKITETRYINLSNVTQIVPVAGEPGALWIHMTSGAPISIDGDTARALRTWLDRNATDTRREQGVVESLIEQAETISNALGNAEWSTQEHAQEILEGLIRRWPDLNAAIAKAKGTA